MLHAVQECSKVILSFSLWISVKEMSALVHKGPQPVAFFGPLPPWDATCIQESGCHAAGLSGTHSPLCPCCSLSS